MVSKSVIETNIWDVIRTLLAGNETVTDNSTKIYGAYPQDYIDDAGGLPFVIVHKPEITEVILTFTKKRYSVSVNIECFADSAAKLKVLSDAVRNSLEGNRATFRITDKMFKFRVTSDTEDFAIRGIKRIHVNKLTCEFDFMGGG